MPETLIHPRTLHAERVFAAFTTRHFAGHDRAESAAAVRALARREGFDGVAFTEQVHKADVATVSQPGSVPAHDGMVTATPGLLLATVAADCALVLLADPEAGVVGACHAGWRGAVGGIVGETVGAMRRLGAERLTGYVAPCISAPAFEVGEEVAAEFDPAFVERGFGPKPHVDLRAAVAAQLAEAGVEAVEVASGCTVREPDRFYSYRGQAGTPGRMFGLIGLRA